MSSLRVHNISYMSTLGNKGIGVTYKWNLKTHFSDVTLTCDGDTRIEAHRVILAGSSKFW